MCKQGRYLTALLVLSLVASARGQESREALDYFEREVRPILVDHCQKCHGPAKQENDLRLDSRAALLKGGITGPAIVPMQPDKSLLVAAIRHEGDYQMPPKAKLTEPQIAAIGHWIKLGAPWPAESAASSTTASKAPTHWAFQPVRDPPVPVVAGNDSPNPIDAFIRAKLAAQQLPHAPPADRRTLIRRAAFDLLGLPPTPEEVAQFVRDADPRAYEQLIERLLAQPQYGEQWGRHWLDVARYSDTKGYVYAREQRFWLHAWVYRDWVVQALNDDLPYNRFLLLQIAADQAAPDERQSLAALGFLTLGRRFLGVQRDIIDDRIDVVTRGTMGLTVGCARCHDHKYDPIPTRDYYSLYGVFQSCTEQIVPVAEPAAKDKAFEAYSAELEKRRKALADGLATRRRDVAKRNRARVGDYLAAQLELHKYPAEGFDQVLAPTDLLPNFVRRWQDYLAAADVRHDPVFAAWHAYGDIPARDFRARAAEVTMALAAKPASELNPIVAQKFATSPATMAEVAVRYGELFGDIERQWQELASGRREPPDNSPPPTTLPDANAEALRQVLYSPRGPCEVPDEPIVNIEYFVDSASCDALWKLQNQVDNQILQSPLTARHAIVLADRDEPVTPRVFKRGNPANPGDTVPRQFLEVLAGEGRQPFAHGSGRLELAQAIIDPANPLTARVIVNRVWQHHFGAGLVRTPSDFGTRAEPPSHPELLDWLATRFIDDGWSLKNLHRRIVLSETYQQASAGQIVQGSKFKVQGSGGNSTLNIEPGTLNPAAVDPENRLLWRMSERRLSFEELRDALLASSGKLERSVGGRASDLFAPTFHRRSLYGQIDRQFLPSTLRIFDFANPDLHIPLRTETTVPQQALFFLNHPLMVGFAQSLAKSTATAASDEDRVQTLYQRVYQRPATPEQVRAALELVESAKQDPETTISPAATAWSYGFGTFDEKTQRVTGFAKLPHFTGTAWQGGSAWPDAKLGWAQLTAGGGHPGNDLAHAVIRRWTAPHDMHVQVRSTLIHEPKQGEGVRGFLVSSRGGLLQQAAVHRGQAELNADALDVRAGDALDFVTDIGKKLDTNQFLWRARLTSDHPSENTFDSQRDFGDQPQPQLTPWEQLAQVLLSANEFVFID